MQQNAYDNINAFDLHHIFDVIDAQPNQLRQNYADTLRDNLTQDDGMGIEHIVMVGMGGSALAGDIARNWLGSRIKVPFAIVRGSDLPGYVSNKTLVIISSYSGNTEETLLAFVQANRLGAHVISITSGGQLMELSKKSGTVCLQLPVVSQPRLAVFACLRAIACVFADTKLSLGADLRRELQDTADFLDTEKLQWSTDKQGTNKAKQLAQHISDGIALIYASPLLASASYKWKIDINENAKQMAFSDVFSELNHNEMQGWVIQHGAVFNSVILATEFETKNMKHRIQITTDILEHYQCSPQMVFAKGSNHIQQLLYIILLGDYVSAYVAIRNQVDPTPVDLVERFKHELAQE